PGRTFDVGEQEGHQAARRLRTYGHDTPAPWKSPAVAPGRGHVPTSAAKPGVDRWITSPRRNPRKGPPCALCGRNVGSRPPDVALTVRSDKPNSHTARSPSATAGTAAATAPGAGDRSRATLRGPAGERDSGEQLHRVRVPLRAVGRVAGRAHGTVHFEGVAASAAAKLVARHGTTIREGGATRRPAE